MTHTDMTWLTLQMVCWHSLWANEEPVQPHPCQQQHDDTDGQAQQEPLPKVYAVAIWVNPECKDSVRGGFICILFIAHKSSESSGDTDVFIYFVYCFKWCFSFLLFSFLFYFSVSFKYSKHVWCTTHWLRYSEKMRLGEVPGSVAMPPMLEE